MKKYYNALNLLHRGDYSKIKKYWERFQNWEKAFYGENRPLDPEKEFAELAGRQINLTLKDETSYPAMLKEISNPPYGIYTLGSCLYDQPAVAIVGTRSASDQGKELARIFAEKIGRAGITIISGLALG